MMNFNELIKSNKQNVKNIIRLITKQDNEDLKLSFDEEVKLLEKYILLRDFSKEKIVEYYL